MKEIIAPALRIPFLLGLQNGKIYWGYKTGKKSINRNLYNHRNDIAFVLRFVQQGQIWDTGSGGICQQRKKSAA